MSSTFPFDVVVVTSPDPDAAPVQTLQPHLPPFVKLVSTTDPFGARCGSGGGTLAAIDACGANNSTESILIIHAGGESSRCPTQMVLGKAWTSLPLSSTEISNPTVLLITTLSRVFSDIPNGSIVVAASDCILELPFSERKVDWSLHDENVIGVAVPAPLDTAKNHGVYCIDEQGKVTQFLQKPSPTIMREMPHCVFGESEAWIDTGVVAFLPGAASVLQSLAASMERCTTSGLKQLYEQEGDSQESLQSFARRHALRVELYTHLMMACSFKTFDSYVNACGDGSLSLDILRQIYDRLSPLSLQALALENGSFTHLGTSREMVTFLTKNDTMKKRARAFLPCCLSPTIVAQNIIVETENCKIGQSTVLEHVYLTAKNVEIGNECLISGVRGSCESLIVPDNMIFQMVPVDNGNGFVYMYLGLDDGIKSGNSMWGMPMEQVLERAGLERGDIWSGDDSQMTLWKARIHPIVKADACMHDELFSWITELNEIDPGQPLSKLSIERIAEWKNLPRVSLSEITHRSEAVSEFQYRDHLEKHVFGETVTRHCNAIREILMNRKHTECNIGSFVGSFQATTTHLSDELKELIGMLDSVVLDAFEKGHYDISGRASMILSELFSNLAVVTTKDSTVSQAEDHLDEFESLNLTDQDSIVTMLKRRDSIFRRGLTSTSLEICARAMERCASVMTELCVAHTTSPAVLPRALHAPLNTWVIATAPARIDLAGGWSDTPPICVEHGGAVCNVAVIVDGFKPLSCRCRLISGGSGILLRSEGRDMKTGDIVSETSASLCRVGDLDGYRNPKSDCSLIKCALVYCGLVSTEQIVERPDDDLTNYMKDFCGVDNVGLEIVTTSLLPHGSGMGTSSILGGCVLSAITNCVGIDTSNADLVHMVLMLEQLLCTGGGWQDQVGGLVGGAKLCTSKNALPLQVKIEEIELTPSFCDVLNQRLLLVFTGQTRLAKNILQTVLRHWARRSKSVVETVNALTSGAQTARDRIGNQDLNGLAECLNAYWEQKKIMAGESSEPLLVRKVLMALLDRDLIQAGSLCGAGGGGFMVLLLKEGREPSDVQQFCQDEYGKEVTTELSWHECKLAHEGLSTMLYENGGANAFHMSWHRASTTK